MIRPEHTPQNFSMPEQNKKRTQQQRQQQKSSKHIAKIEF